MANKTNPEIAAEAAELVGSLLYKKALSGDTNAMIFYLKSQAGWSDKVTEEQLAFAELKSRIFEEAAKQILSLSDENSDLAQAKSIISTAIDTILVRAAEKD